MIHPSAIIHPDARLGADVSVGPFAVVEGAAQIGDRCAIHGHAVIGAHVVIGAENTIGCGAVIGGDPQDFSFRAEVKSEVRIGNGNRVREHCTIHRGTSEGSATVIGDDCFLMAGAHLAHNVRLGNGVVIANNALLGGHVVVEDGVFIGGGCVFHQHVRVGRLAICQGLSAFSKDIPPFCLAAQRNGIAGLNVVGLRRAGFSSEQRAEIRAAFALVFRSGKNTAQALAAARERPWAQDSQAFFDFIASAKKRGICALIGSSKGLSDEASEAA